MRLEAHDNLQKPIKREITRVVVYDDYDNPIAIVVKYDHGMCYVGHVGDKEFNNMLQVLGINRFVMVDKIKSNPNMVIGSGN